MLAAAALALEDPTSDWESHGGVGGITARYDDILSLARLYDHAGDAVGFLDKNNDVTTTTYAIIRKVDP